MNFPASAIQPCVHVGWVRAPSEHLAQSERLAVAAGKCRKTLFNTLLPKRTFAAARTKWGRHVSIVVA
jgi:hypothetical protein